jgi:hypothetical protein
MMKIKVWTKPKLVVLCKGRPEEGVLQVCKTSGRRGPNVNNCAIYSTPCQRVIPT